MLTLTGDSSLGKRGLTRTGPDDAGESSASRVSPTVGPTAKDFSIEDHSEEVTMARRTMILTLLAFLSGVASGSWFLTPLLSQARRTVQTKDLTRFDLGSWCEGKEVTIQLLEIGPGTSGRHYHPAHSFAYVLDGSQIQTVQGRSPISVKTGDVLHDGPGEVHETQNTAPLKLLVFRITEKGKVATTQIP